MSLRDPNPQDDYNRASVEILFSDADLALTFTDIALEHTDRQAIARTTQNARKAYDLILGVRSSFAMTAEESKALEAKIVLLRDRLLELGENFD